MTVFVRRWIGWLVTLSLITAVLAGCDAPPPGTAPETSPGTPAGISRQCAGNTRPEMCEAALAAVIAELTRQGQAGGQLRIDDVQCAHGRCWTWAFYLPRPGAGEWTMSVDWTAGGEIVVGFVTE